MTALAPPASPVPPAAPPDLSVVVIVHNDAELLPYAVRSVLTQTLRSVEAVVVDDCSTDGSYRVAQELAAAHPGRVRAFRLPRNSGGCGAPRNHGLRQARGRQVMFLDSDDELERNACRNLLRAAELTGADLVCGRCVRVHHRGRRTTTTDWYPWLYTRSRTLESITDFPELLACDTLATPKCYRRDFLLERGLTFPEGVHYEDVLFTAEAYLAARRIALIPQIVYHWQVRTGGAARSITHRRSEIASLAGRMEIHRRVADLLERPGCGELKLYRDIGFLRHDLALHLRELPSGGERYRREFPALTAERLARVDPEAYRRVRRAVAVCARLLHHGDTERLLPAVAALLDPGTLTSPLAERDGRIYWCAEHLDDPVSREVLDVTDAGYHTLPLDRLVLGNRLTALEDADGLGTVRLSGSIVNPLGRITPKARVRGRLEFHAPRRSRRAFRLPLSSLRLAPDRLDWDAEADLARVLRPLGLFDTEWEIRLALEVDGVRLTTRPAVLDGPLPTERPGGAAGVGGEGGAAAGAVTGEQARAGADPGAGRAAFRTARPLPVRPRLTRLTGDWLLPGTTNRAHLVLRLVAGERAGRAGAPVRRLLDRGRDSRAADAARLAVRTARRARRTLHAPRTKARVHRLLCRLPVRRGLVVFESHLGRQYSDSPRALYEEMRRQQVAFRPVWAYAGRAPTGFPPEATLVRRWSWAYVRALARAEYWIDNQGFPPALVKRPGITYLQTWHGTALKRMGADTPEHQRLGRAARDRRQRALSRFDHFLVRSEHDIRTLAPAFGLAEPVPLRTGYPRNDALVAARRREAETGRRERGPLAEKLGIPPDRRVLLYAPTFREDGGRESAGRDSGGPGGPAWDGPAWNGPAHHPGPHAPYLDALYLDTEEFAARFGDRWVLLVRGHYLTRPPLPPGAPGAVIEAGGAYDITPLLLLADALITDYSSVMFDYVLLDRPMLFHLPDWDDYAESRGTYFDLPAEAPGPVARTQRELFAAIEELDAADSTGAEEGPGAAYAEARRRFAARYAEYDRGDAARLLISRFFAPGEPRDPGNPAGPGDPGDPADPGDPG